MPQLDLANFSPQIIWLVITFSILWFLMAKIALPRIGLVLEERQKRITDNLKLAEDLQKEARAEFDSYQAAILEARDRAREIISDTTQEVSKNIAGQKEELDQSISESIRIADSRIESATVKAMADIQNNAAQVASAATECLTGKTLPEEIINTSINTVMDKNT